MTVRRFDEKILNALLDKYENSLLYTGRNRRNQSISFTLSKKTLPEYFDESSLQFETIHQQLMEAEQKGFIRLAWKNGKTGHILEKCTLCPDKAEELYRYLRRRPRAEKEAGILAVCSEETGRDPLIDRFLGWTEERIRAGESVRQFVDADHPEKLRETCDLLFEILHNREQVFLREFSVRFWNDSKIAEKELARAAGIIARFTEDPDLEGLNSEQILEEFGILKNPSWVMLKGTGRFRMEDSSWVSLGDFPGGIGLSSTDILKIRWDRDRLPVSVVTIENLTSFHRWQKADTLAIYLGGYHNRAKRAFLRGLYDTCAGRNVVFMHFGDIDCGGFRIWRDLCEKTGIPFRTIFMDRETYLQFPDYGKPLTDRDRKELERMCEDPTFAEQKGLFLLMLREGKKIEQECIQTENLREKFC